MKIAVKRAELEGIVRLMYAKDVDGADLGVSMNSGGNFILTANFTGDTIIPVEGELELAPASAPD